MRTTPENITKLAPGEIFDIPGYHSVYAVTVDGCVWSYPKICGTRLHAGRWLRQYTERTGYKFVVLQVAKTRRLHYIQGIVAKTFLGDRSHLGLQVNHIDGNKENNHFTNLEWVTPSENIRHAFKLGKSVQTGSRNAHSKLTESAVFEIRQAVALGESQVSQARKFGVTASTVSRVVNLGGWTHV